MRTGVRVENTLNEFTEFDPRFRGEILAAGFPVNNAGRATTVPGLMYQFLNKPRIVANPSITTCFPRSF